MILAIVKKAVISTVKHPSLEGRKLFWVQPVTPELEERGDAFITIDAVKSRAGNLVLVNKEGGGTMEVLGLKDSPVQSVIVGIVDKVRMQEPKQGSKSA